MGRLTQSARPSREIDFYAWCLHEASSLRVRRPASVDWDGLAEELEDMGLDIKRRLTSHLAHALEHLLKLRYEPSSAYRADQEHRWKVDLANHRDELNYILDNSRTLRNDLPNFIAKAYPRACRLAGLAMRNLTNWQDVFPRECPWTIKQIRDDEFFPSPAESNGHR